MIWYDRDGNPLPDDDYPNIEKLLTSDYKIVDCTVVKGSTVSTVWLGLDYSFGGGPPLIFETMIFGGGHGGWCKRYATEIEAQTDHELIVIALLEGQNPDSVV